MKSHRTVRPKLIRQLLLRPGSVGEMEALAGIGSDHASRLAFWLDCDRIARARADDLDQYQIDVFAIARERCHAMTFERIKRGELCLI